MIENVYIKFKTKIRDNWTILQKDKYTSSIESNNTKLQTTYQKWINETVKCLMISPGIS